MQLAEERRDQERVTSARELLARLADVQTRDGLGLRYSPCGNTRAAMDPAAVGSPADMPSSG
jgi:hypothetical protein